MLAPFVIFLRLNWYQLVGSDFIATTGHLNMGYSKGHSGWSSSASKFQLRSPVSFPCPWNLLLNLKHPYKFLEASFPGRNSWLHVLSSIHIYLILWKPINSNDFVHSMGSLGSKLFLLHLAFHYIWYYQRCSIKYHPDLLWNVLLDKHIELLWQWIQSHKVLIWA